MTTAFGRRLQQLRTVAGLTQVELAQQTGLHYVSINRLEMGHRQNPPWSTVCVLADALGVSTEEFRSADMAGWDEG